MNRPFAVDLASFPADALPVIQPTATFAVESPYAGAWTVAGDLNGDDVAEFVQVRMSEMNDTHAVAAVAAYRLDGTVLWHWGNPAEGVGALHSDAPCQIHDWNRDGRQEVVVATHTHVVVLDGATGKEIWRFATPGPDAADCLLFTNLTGGERDDLLLKTRYHCIWAYTWQGRLLWKATDPGGMKTAHQPVPVDLDGDGFDEIIAGYAVLDHNGKILWTLNGPALGLGNGHLDCARVLTRGACLKDWRLAFTCCGDQALLCMDGHGRIVWQQRGMHFESLFVGRLIHGCTDRQIIVDIDHQAPGKSPLHVYDLNGILLGEINSVYGRVHPLIAWGDDPTERIVACEDRLLVSGETGKPLARFATPLSEGITFEQTERPHEHKERGPFHLIGRTGNLFGAGRQDLMFTTNPGGAVWLYRNPGGARNAGLPVGTGRNVTLY